VQGVGFPLPLYIPTDKETYVLHLYAYIYIFIYRHSRQRYRRRHDIDTDTDIDIDIDIVDIYITDKNVVNFTARMELFAKIQIKFHSPLSIFIFIQV